MSNSEKNAHVAANVWRLKDVFVNIYFIRNPNNNSWILIDTGLKTAYKKVLRTAAELFDFQSKPAFILLTHGHFDHTGSVKALMEEWEVPVFAHQLEIPFLNGTTAYLPPEPAVGGGMMAYLSFIYPKKPIDISSNLKPLQDGIVPGMPEWSYIHTPGHTPGHISLFRESDRVVIAGDACVTTKQESALSVMLQSKIVSGPPKYFTPDWISAEESLRKIQALDPEVLATGHGVPLSGPDMRKQLTKLVQHFKEFAVPSGGRYVPSRPLVQKT